MHGRFARTVPKAPFGNVYVWAISEYRQERSGSGKRFTQREGVSRWRETERGRGSGRAQRRSPTSRGSPASRSRPRRRPSTAATRSAPATRQRVVEAAEQLSFTPEPARPQPARRAHRHRRPAHERPRGPLRHPDPHGRRGRVRRRPGQRVPLRRARRRDPRAAPPARRCSAAASTASSSSAARPTRARRSATTSRCPSSTPTRRPTTRPTCRSRPTTWPAAASPSSTCSPAAARRIAHITGEPAYAAAQDRAVGVHAALADAGLELVGDVMYCEWSEHWGRDAAGDAARAAPRRRRHPLRLRPDRPRRARHPARPRHATVPDDVAVIGFDNWEVLTTNSRPELTSIDANLQQLGRTAAQRVFAALDGVELGAGHAVPAGAAGHPRLDDRASLTAARGRQPVRPRPRLPARCRSGRRSGIAAHPGSRTARSRSRRPPPRPRPAWRRGRR